MSTIPDSDSRELSHIAHHVSAGGCVLFLGAGVHGRPPEGSTLAYPETRRPPTGPALAQQLAEECGYPGIDRSDLQKVGLYYEYKFSRYQLVNRIREAVEIGKKPSPLLDVLARLPFSMIATTNYDSLFEQALIGAGKRPYVSVYNKTQFSITPDYPGDHPTPAEPFIFKIHGDVQVPDSLVVTSEDYIDFILRLSDRDPYYPIPDTFLYLFKRQPTLFLGYSMGDVNLRAFLKMLRWRIDSASVPPIYCVDYAPDGMLVNVLKHHQRFVTFLTQDLWTFVPELHRLSARG